MALAAGQRIGDYEVLNLLGTGGMGRVYRVRNVISDRVEAMKILLPDYASEPELAARFTAEIRTLATLEHPNIAQLRTAFQFENQLVMVMEYVEGATLDQIASQSQIPLNQVLEYAMQVLSALSYAHGRGITHRDIKPSNIMITSHGLAKLMDFGIAKSGGDLQLTRPGTTMGSVYYMSPEQVRGGTVDARSDLYSFGVTLYELVTGKRPFQADTSFTVLNSHLNETPKPPIEVNPALPPALNSIILCAMAKEPTDRFQSADAFRNAIKATVDALQFPTTAAPQPPAVFQPQAPPQQQPYQPQAQAGFAPVVVPPPPPPASKNRRPLWMALGALAALIAIAAAATLVPRMMATHASQQSGSATVSDAQQQPQSTPTTETAATPAAPVSPTPSPQETTPAPPPDVTAPAPSPSTTAPAPAPATSPVEKPTSSARHAAPAVHRHTPNSSESAPAESQPAQTASAPAAPAPSAEEFRAARDRYANLGARADAAKSGVQSIRSQQQAQGFDLRGDILAAMSRLNNDMNESNLALTQNDVATANEYMDRADKELATLEKFLGR